MITKTQAKIAAQMLEMASEEFSNHSSNDYELPNTPENLEFTLDMLKVLGWDSSDLHLSEDETIIYLSDSWVMDYCAKVLAKHANENA